MFLSNYSFNNRSVNKFNNSNILSNEQFFRTVDSSDLIAATNALPLMYNSPLFVDGRVRKDDSLYGWLLFEYLSIVDYIDSNNRGHAR